MIVNTEMQQTLEGGREGKEERSEGDTGVRRWREGKVERSEAETRETEEGWKEGWDRWRDRVRRGIERQGFKWDGG